MTKKEILQRLLDKEQITFDEFWVLLEETTSKFVILPQEPQYPIYPQFPVYPQFPYTYIADTNSTMTNGKYDNGIKEITQ